MHRDEFRYRSKDSLNLYARVWTPDGDINGVVALVHGLGEYGGRYADIGQSFVDRGYAFVAGDLRGHGVSEGRRAFVSRLDDFMEDLDRYCDEVRAYFPGKPLFLYCFSMGSTIGAAYLVRRHPRAGGRHPVQRRFCDAAGISGCHGQGQNAATPCAHHGGQQRHGRESRQGLP